MSEEEVIIVNNIPPKDYDQIVYNAIKYAIISIPFTVNRMKLDFDKRILNIAKGKLAEGLFEYFCKKNNINCNFQICATPFWEIDKRDFILNNMEWDIKNNFIFCDKEILDGNYTDLPALVPNRYDGDQWSKREEKLIDQKYSTAFLFTFMKNEEGFIEIELDEKQKKFLEYLYNKYEGKPQKKAPFILENFWQKFAYIKNKIKSRPFLIITGYATQVEWNIFKDTGPGTDEENYRDYKKPFWYTKSCNGVCNFLDGRLYTKIKNSTAPVSMLPSFLSLYPNLSTNIKNGIIRKI